MDYSAIGFFNELGKRTNEQQEKFIFKSDLSLVYFNIRVTVIKRCVRLHI